MKKTIAHIYETYPAGDPNGPHCYKTVGDRYKLVTLCEKAAGDLSQSDGDVYIFDKNPCAIFSKVILTRLIYINARNNFYRRMLSDSNASLVHAHFGPVGAGLANLMDELGLPMVVTFYGMDVSRLVKQAKWIKRYQGMFKTRSLFIVLCTEAKSRLEKIGCPSEKIRIADCLNDLSLYKYNPRTRGNGTKFLIAARFVEKKGYPVLFEAIAGLVNKGRDVKLTVLGYGSPGQKKVLDDCIKKLKIGNRVSIMDTSGMGSKFASLYKEHLYSNDIFVLPSIAAKDGDDEGGPSLTLVAAQSSGMPVVTTPFPGSERSVIDGKTGILCRPDDPGSLAEKMEYLIENPGLCNILGKNASEYVNENLSLEKEIKKITEIYEELL
ncbi:MAG: glycosyltransferase [Candidatus Omnitrophota bacterium]|jgi:glycosyltransferase involved in cell wall biosynthesis